MNHRVENVEAKAPVTRPENVTETLRKLFP